MLEMPLGKKTSYPTEYDARLLFPIARSNRRAEMGITGKLPFVGFDQWNAYELSWLNLKGKPEVAIAEILVPYDSTFIIEGKSLKLYLNSFTLTHLESFDVIKNILQKDLSDTMKSPVLVNIRNLNSYQNDTLQYFQGECLDNLDVECQSYTLQPDFLKIQNSMVEEKLYSNLLKSNCMVTGQPDWGSVFVHYKGPKIDHEGLLKYLVSFRSCQDVVELCIEKIFMDILTLCKPEQLLVYGRYTRRGGIDINPCRTTHEALIPKNFNGRHVRQ